MNHSQITGILIIFGLAYFLGWVSLTRSYSDQTELINQVRVERGLRIEINNLNAELRVAERLYDIQSGRLLEANETTMLIINKGTATLSNGIAERAEFVESIKERKK